MLTIPLLNGQPESPIPAGTIAVLNNGDRLDCYFEGEEVPQPQAQPVPDWEGFYDRNKAALLELSSHSNYASVATAMMIIFSRRNEPNFSDSIPDLIDYWNWAIAPLMDAQQIAAINQESELSHLPVRLNEQGDLEWTPV